MNEANVASNNQTAAAAAAFEPHMLELDSTKLSNLDIFGKKKFPREYNLIQRKIIFSTKLDYSSNKSNNRISNSTINKNNYLNTQDNLVLKLEREKKYLSNYKFFRDFLSSNFESTEIKTELFETKSLLENSKKLREEIEKYLNQSSLKEDQDFFLQKDKQEDIVGKNINNTNKSFRGDSNLNNINNNNNNKLSSLLQNFKLLKMKDKYDNSKQEDFFRFYSELDYPIDIYSMISNDNAMQNKFLYFHKKLTKSYYQEQFFSEYASEYNKPLKSKNSISPEIRMRIPVEYIDHFFKSRGNETFASLDAFMVKYDREHNVSLREKDLLENIYGILSKCDSSNFLSFLYSKNEEFRYIYDAFAHSNSSKSLEGLDLSGISNDSEIKVESK